jgi:hypothetical protein
MDWDVEPTAFSEFVTIGATGGILPPSIPFTSDDGFASAHPLAGPTSISAQGLFVDSGPADHGALFDIDLGVLHGGQADLGARAHGVEPEAVAA